MSYLISDGFNEAQLELNSAGQSFDVTDYIQFINDVNDELMTEMKIPSMERMYDIVLYPGLIENALPSDWLAICEPEAPYGNPSPNFTHNTARTFTHWPYGRITGYRSDHENTYLIAQETDGSTGIINSCDSLTDGGTWAVTGDSASLSIDEEIRVQGQGSIRFTVAPSGGSTTLTCTGLTEVDISDYLTQGRIALDLFCPSSNTTAVSSVQIRIGSSASDYYQVSATTRHRGDTILNSWGPISFDMSQKTTTGSPDSAATDYLQVVITHGLTGVSGVYRLDNIFLTKGVYYKLPYYSRNNVKSVTNVYQRKVTADSDTILCPTEMDNVYKYKTLSKIAKRRLQDTGLATEFDNDAMPFVRTLSAKYPSQEQRTQTQKYKRWRTF